MSGVLVSASPYSSSQKPGQTQSSEYASPLWVSHWRKPFMQAQFPLEIEEKVSHIYYMQ